MNKETIRLYLILFVNIFLNQFCFASDRDLLLKRNIFFERSADLLASVDKLASANNKDSNAVKLAEYNSFLSQTDFLLNKLRNNRLLGTGASNSKLEELFQQINEKKSKILNSDNQFLLKETKEKLELAFDSILKGILLDLCFDHITSFRQNLILYLKNILFLTAYWKTELESGSIWSGDENSIKEKVRGLFFLRDRTACFVGKLDEISLLLFELADDPILLDRDLYKQVDFLLEQALFSVYCFFSENFDPDNSIYKKRLDEFVKLDFQQKIRLCCKNNMNISMAGESLSFQIRDFEMPSFLRRHWFSVTAGSLVAVGSGILVYQNSEYLFGGDFEKDIQKFYDGYIKKWIFDPFAKLKNSFEEKFFPDIYLEENKDTLTKASDRLKETLKKSCEGLRKKGLINFDETELNDLDKLSSKLYSVFEEQGTTVLDKDYDKIKELLANFKKFMKGLNEHLPNLTKAAGLISPSNESTSSSEKSNKSGQNYWVLGGYRKTMDEVKDKVDDFIKNFEKVKKSGETQPTIESLLGVIDNFTKILDSVGNEVPKLLEIFEIIKAMSCIYGMDASKRVVGMIRFMEAVKLWVPIIVTTIVFIVSTKMIYNYVVKKRIKIVTSSVSEIYRILLYYKSASVDMYLKDFKYRDQGLMSYWLEVLGEDFQILTKENRNKIAQLIAELQSPDLSVLQKIEFVKLEWGKYLFEVQAI